MDKITKRWIRDVSDELAIRNDCWFDEAEGQFVVDWMHDYLRLYEGDAAGEPFECRDWQYEATMRLFGWQRKSEDWGRIVRRFRNAIVFIPKKNKKSPTLAAWACYKAFGDGEMGEKCFMTAKDGGQIRENVVRHVHEMIRQSPLLLSECKINKTTGNVFHHPTRSVIMPLSSDNVATQKSKEGLNGSVFVDEVHVVDKAHMNRLSRAGISRAEPMQVEVSTAGDEPESYGKGRFDYAAGVIDGRHKDDQTLAIIYAAPQDMTDEAIHADPIAIGKSANPAWGHTIKESEYVHDYTVSKASLHDFSLFKKYRLNIWQQSTNPWLSVHDWRQCPATELVPHAETTAGLDLSRTTDITAWVVYQAGDTPRCRGHYWLPRSRVMELEAQYEIPLSQWVQDGWVTVSGQKNIRFADVHEYIKRQTLAYSQLRYVGYDPYNAPATVEYCKDQGLEMVEMRQGVATLSGPAKTLQGLVVSHNIDHCGDPVLAWMIGNTSVREDENGNIKPVKATGGVRKHIDGVVALIMAIGVASANPYPSSVYNTPGMLAL